MTETLGAQQLLAAGAGGGLVVLFGAFYAFFFAMNRLRPARYWPLASIISFALLVTCSVVLSTALKLDFMWQLAIGFILVCYFFSPHFIWRLSVATHEEHIDEPKNSLSTE